MSNAIRFFQLLLTCLALAAFAAMNVPTRVIAQEPTNGLIMLIEFEKIEGLRHWELELDERGLTALVQAQRDVIDKYPEDFARLARKDYPVTGIDAEKPFWIYHMMNSFDACAKPRRPSNILPISQCVCLGAAILRTTKTP